MNNFKNVHHTAVTTLFKNAVYAIQDEEKLHWEKRPLELQKIWDSILRTTVMHDGLDGNQSNENHVLTSDLGAYERPFLSHSEQLMLFYDNQME